LWNRGLPADVTIHHQLLWPLLLLPIVLLNQIVTPHPIWVVLLVAQVGLYGIAIAWVRLQAGHITVERKRIGTILVAGDQLEEAFTLSNHSPLPVLWAELRDESTLPGYHAGQVVSCNSNNHYRWSNKVVCQQRGLYRLGPQQLHLADPLGFFGLTIDFPQTDTVIIYPRVLHLPTVVLPQGSQSGTARRRRPLYGVQPAATVRAYQPTDSLRHVHWPITAHRGSLMVKELESEPSGTVWIILDLDQAVHRGEGENGTFEYSIVVAASLTAALLQDEERRDVGLYTISGNRAIMDQTGVDQTGVDRAAEHSETDHTVVVMAPQSGQAQLWSILAGLAPVQPTDISLAEQLRSARISIGKRSTVIVVTTTPREDAPDWLAELVHLQSSGISSSVMLVTDDEEGNTDDKNVNDSPMRDLLAGYGVDVQVLSAQAQLPPALTFRRTRRVIRSTPTGGAISYEVEEEVG